MMEVDIDNYKQEINKNLNEIEEYINKINEINNKITTIKNDLYSKVIEVNDKRKEDQEEEEGEGRETNKSVFLKRESQITYFFKDKNFVSLYNIVLSSMIIYVFRYLISINSDEINNIKFKFHTFFELFFGFQMTFIIILFLTFVSISMSFLIKFSIFFTSKYKILSFLLYFLIFLLFYVFFGIYLLKEINVSVINKLIISCEIIKNIIKLFSFFSYYLINKEHIVKTKKSITTTTKTMTNTYHSPNISSFINFLIAPTLVFQEKYPVITIKNKIKKLIINIVNTLFCLLLAFLHFEFTLYPFLSKLTNMTDSSISNSTISNTINTKTSTSTDFSYDKENNFNDNLIQGLLIFIINGFISLIVVFFGLIHSYHNITALVISFADRSFYDDFWNSITPYEFAVKIGKIGFLYVKQSFLPMLTYYSIPISLHKPIAYISICVILEYIVYMTVSCIFPISSFLLLLGYFLSKVFIKYGLTYDKMKLINLLMVSFGIGLIMFVLSFETVIMNGNLLDKYQYLRNRIEILSFLERYFVPKVLLLYMIL